MLTHLHIKNIAIIESLSLDWESGLSVITGETGAGKSIVMDALDLVLGARASSHVLRANADRAEITAVFDITHLSAVKTWLDDNDIEHDNECIIRRVIGADGRNKVLLNGTPILLTQAREIGESLVHIHGQHAHQQLLKRDYQRILLDNYAGLSTLCNAVKDHYNVWADIQRKLNDLKNNTNNASTRIELLSYQVDEIKKASIKQGEYDALDKEHKQLANAEQLMSACQQAISSLENSEINSSELQKFADMDAHLKNACELLIQSQIQQDEALHELKSFLEHAELNPERLSEVEQRLSLLHQLTRKYHKDADDLNAYADELAQELDALQNADQHLAALEKDLKTAADSYLNVANQLSEKRKKAAVTLAKQVTEKMKMLGMPNGSFSIALLNNKDNTFSTHGLEKIEFQVAANPGQPAQALSKVASGGELSRISLAIQVITAETTTSPTLIFDEVDVGIGGATADIVGRLLRELSVKTQIICITHLPQVAAKGKQHLRVQKFTTDNQTKTDIISLTADDRIKEIARMLGGVEMTDKTLAHASEMLDNKEMETLQG